jgi:hypothetical protein
LDPGQKLALVAYRWKASCRSERRFDERSNGSACCIIGLRRTLMKDLQLSDCEIIGADEQIRRPSLDRVSYRFQVRSCVRKVTLDLARSAHRVPMLGDRSDAKTDVGQGHRYPGGDCRPLSCNYENFKSRSVSRSHVHGLKECAA